MKIIKINSSAFPAEHSVTRKQVEAIMDHLLSKHPDAEVIDNDLPYADIHFLQGQHLDAFFAQEPNEDQLAIRAISDRYTQELIDSDVLVIGAPMYNFSIPSSLKAYFDLVIRAGKTFKYDENGRPHGLVENKKAYIVIASGGTPLNSGYDFSSGLLKTMLGFIGITDVTIIDMATPKSSQEEKEANAQEVIATL
jgi:FMN-dependent NADH-azoreductase